MSEEKALRHAWVPPQKGDSRAPCPVLNALCNHNYLPHDGKNLTAYQIAKALINIFNVSMPLAIILALLSLFTCRSTKVDLECLAYHGRIEHDASLVHDNAAPGEIYAPIEVDDTLLRQLISDSGDGHSMTLVDLGRARARRNHDALNGVLLDSVHGFLTSAEAAGILMLLGGQGKSPKYVAPVNWVEEFMGHERMPKGWSRPTEAIGFINAIRVTNQVKLLTPVFK